MQYPLIFSLANGTEHKMYHLPGRDVDQAASYGALTRTLGGGSDLV